MLTIYTGKIRVKVFTFAWCHAGKVSIYEVFDSLGEQKMNDAILVLTNSKDGQHTDVVVSKLRQRDQRVFRFDADVFANGESRLDFCSDKNQFGFTMRNADGTLSSREVKSVWYRRPNSLHIEIKDPVQRRYAEEEITNLLEGLWMSMPDVFWLNNPVYLTHARKKIYQMFLAREAGFMMPKTIITNDPERAKRFYYECGGKIIFKAIQGELLDYGEKSFSIPTTFITERHIENINLIKHASALFQEFIEKAYELRITVVGDKIFPVKIMPLTDISHAVDWRYPELMDKLSYSPTVLPEKISAFCSRLLQQLRLSFGAFDFAVGKNGEVYFLEINPNGQWYWLEDRTGLLISDAIADMLIRAS